MIETLISSKTRIKLLLKFFLNHNTTAYLRGLEREFGESSNAIRLELNRLEEAGVLSSFLDGNKKMFRANPMFPLFHEIKAIIMKTVGLDKIIQTVIERLGDVDKVFLVGEFAKGIDSPIIDLIFIGNIDRNYLMDLVDRAEDLINRKIRYIIYGPEEFEALEIAGLSEEALLMWSKE